MSKKKHGKKGNNSGAMVLASGGGIVPISDAPKAAPRLKEEPSEMLWEGGTHIAFRKWCLSQVVAIYQAHGLDEHGKPQLDEKQKPKPHDILKAKEAIKSFALKIAAGGYIGRRTFASSDITGHLSKAAWTNGLTLIADHYL